MHNLVRRFLNEDKINKELYFKSKKYNNQHHINLLHDRFYNYIFEVYLISYIEKSLRFKALEFKQKRKKLFDRELYVLNVIDDDFKEEKINNIRDVSIDFLEEISMEIDFKDISSNKKLVKAIESITNKQRLVLFMRYIEEKEEKQIAKEMNVSKQSVNKVKIAGLRKIRDYLGGEINGRVV